MIPARLKKGDGIGLAAPSWLATPEVYEPICASLEGMGFQVIVPEHLYANGWGYAASDGERAADLNQLIRDPRVKMIFFGGGEGGDDLLPLLDYEAARQNPKLWLSYSDGTSILNAIHAKTGVVTYYGQAPRNMTELSAYNLAQFEAHILRGGVPTHIPNSPWRTLTPGVAEGTLMGGYLDNFIFLDQGGWTARRPGERYVLFIEDHEMFFKIEHESALLSRLEQCPLMKQTAGLLFGHYSAPVNEYLMERLTRLGQRHGIPVAYCDDFGHGENHAILPIGVRAVLDTGRQTLTYPEA